MLRNTTTLFSKRFSTVQQILKKPELFQNNLFINNQWVNPTGNNYIDVVDPGNEEVFAACAKADVSDVRKAIQAAEKSFKSFAALDVSERCSMLQRWGNLILEHKEDIGKILSVEQGKPLAEAIGEAEYAASFLIFYAENSANLLKPVVTGDVEGKSKVIAYRKPVGVVGAITPWNFPAAMITRKAAAALAVGCPIIIKPSELTPFTANALGVLATEAGIPAGAVNIVTGDAAEIAGELTDHFNVRKITFTGSTRVGKILMSQAVQSVKRISLELGGNAPLIVFDDADMDLTIAQSVAAKSRNAGQTCVSPNRFLVHEAVYEEFLEKFTKSFSAVKVGYGLNNDSKIGPLINSNAIKKVEAHVADAISRGAKVLCGGKALPKAEYGSALFYPPTVLRDCTTDMLCFKEETFGPLCSVFKFKTKDEAFELANKTNAGLASYVFTTSPETIVLAQERLQYGMVGINQGSVSHCSAPFGGVKESGLGREGSIFGLDEYIDVKTVHYNVSAVPVPSSIDSKNTK